MKRADFEVKFTNADTGLIKGFASTYGGEPDAAGDVIAPGALTNSLAQIKTEGRTLKILRAHDPNKPIGRWLTLTDTPTGLMVEGKLTLDNTDGADAYALIKDGTLDALSIGYAVKDFDPRPGGGRTLTEIELVEISVVTFGANARAKITDVKGVDPDPATEAPKAAKEEADKMADEAATELAAQLKKAEDRIGDLEAKAANINAAPKVANTNRPIESKAFETVLRHGPNNMPADEFKALQNANDTAGGFLVPEDFRAELVKTVTEFSPMRTLARITGTGRDELTMPKRTGKVAGGWTAELADQPESEPTYGQIKIPVHEMGVFCTISNANLEDSAFDMQAELTLEFGEAFGTLESDAFIRGDGAGKPRGILDSADIQTDTTAAAGVIDADDLITTFYRLKSPYRRVSAWMMNAATLAEVRKLKTASGDYIWRESIADGQPPTILGRPVYEAVDCPDPVSNSKAIIFGDFGTAYRIVSRLDIAVLRDPYSLAGKSAVKFHARQRVGGDVVQPEAARTIQVA
ncbi:phage major capsid protein [Yoonia sp. SDW83-1]|uniref:phage major capsid protein n=1 Tax=Yoonia sp. SDW83-1 TaxID=3366945 RepID=UPI00398C82BC